MKKLREVIVIDDDKCNGCGECLPNCPEGALQVIDGKARLISDLFCDGLGACVGHCPTGAMAVEERAAEPYDETKVMENVVRQGPNTIAAHLEHLKQHGATDYLRQATEFLKQHDMKVPAQPKPAEQACGCPGARVVEMERPGPAAGSKTTTTRESQLRNWPVQIMLIPTSAPYLKNADLLIAADCVPMAYAPFHEDFLRNRVLLVGCPKLDDSDFYREKLTEIFKTNAPRSVTCVHMEVPCCFGLVELTQAAIAASGRKISFEDVTITIRGKVK